MEGCHNFLFICRPAVTWMDLPKFSSSSVCVFIKSENLERFILCFHGCF